MDDGSAIRLTHSAFRYDGDEDYAAFLIPFICGALEGGEYVAVATTPGRTALLRWRLGPDATRVRFLDPAGWYARPVRAISVWAHLLRTHPGAHLINDNPDGADAWTRCDSALNAALAGLAGHVLCPHDRDHAATARRTHRVLHDDGWHVSDEYVEPEQLLTALPEPPYPVTGDPVLSLPVEDTVADLRSLVRGTANAEGWLDPDGVDALVLAVSELTTNAIRYGGVSRELRLWLMPDAVVGEVTDDGSDPPGPLAGYLPPTPGEIGGMGMWLVSQGCDAFTIRGVAGRTHARFAIRR